jgi:hypothetical protein
MCAKCDTLEDDLTVEVLLAEAEHALILAQTDAGESVAGAIRPLSPVERRAKMRFGEIEALEHSAAEEAAKLLASNAQVYIMAVISAIFGTADAVQPAAVVDAIESLNRAQPDDVLAEIAASQNAMSEILRQTYAGASVIVIGEARRQGVKKTPKPLTAEPDRFDLLAKAVALHPWTRLTSKLQADMMNPATLMKTALAEGDPILRADVQKALEAIPLDGAEDLARQTIHTAHGAGRLDAAETMQPEEIYASELMDGATCPACAQVDGKDYDTMTEAKVEYETGGYGACKGGARCRGTLVFQYSGLGIDAPPPAPEPVAPPKTPRKRKPKTPPPAPPAPVLPDVIANPPLSRRQALELERQNAAKAKADAPPGLPPAPTATPPKRRKGTVQRYDSLDQLPIDHGKAGDSPLLIARDTNPGYTASNGSDKNYSNNCSSVVQAYEFQRRGYDVKAAPVKAGRGRYDEEYIGQWWEDADGNPVKPTYAETLPLPKAYAHRPKTAPRGTTEFVKSQLDEYIESMPDGARGFVALHWSGNKGGGHVFSWEKVDGKPVYLEGQTGNTDAARHLAPGKFKPDSLRVTRIDDKIPTQAVTEALETRPAELAEELAGKAPTVAQMKAQSQYRARLNPDGTRTLILPKYRINPFTRKWEEVPPEVLKQAQDEFDRTERKRLGK